MNHHRCLRSHPPLLSSESTSKRLNLNLLYFVDTSFIKNINDRYSTILSTMSLSNSIVLGKITLLNIQIRLLMSYTDLISSTSPSVLSAL